MALYAMAMALSKTKPAAAEPGLSRSARSRLTLDTRGGGSNSRAHYDTFSHNIHSESELALASQPLPFAVGKAVSLHP